MIRPGAAPRLGPPIAVQIIALLVLVLVLGQIATFVVVSILPPPRPPVYRLEEIAAALRGSRAPPRFAPALIEDPDAPAPGPPPKSDPREAELTVQLARLLRRPVEAVRLKIEAPPPYALFLGGGRGRGLRRRGLSPRDEVGAGPDAAGGPSSSAGPPASGPPASGPPASGLAAPGLAETGLPAPGRPAGGGGADGASQEAAPSDGPQSTPPDRPPPDRLWRIERDRLGFAVGEIQASLETTPGHWITVRSPRPRFLNEWQRRLALWFLACLLILTPLGYLFANRLTAPIRRFARAADQLGRDPRAPPLTLRGPAEIGQAAAAFNDMQARLARYVEDRTAMIGAIAHDLRTPLARIQFKLQRAPEAVARDIRGDLGQMEAMLAAVLAFVRDVAPTVERGPLDLMSLLEVVADDAGAMGSDVTLTPGPAAVVDGDASALQRLFVNLVDNAVKYGGGARLSLQLGAREVQVCVNDDGPGIPPAELERVFEPFHRIESSRSRETGGIGLGLSVARSIARAHGGDVVLQAPGRGLQAVVSLPLSSAAAKA